MTVSAGVELAEIGLPDFGLPDAEPSLPQAAYQARLAAAADSAAAAGLDALVVYADREHFANLSYLTGFDPRFEEALLLLVPGRAPVLLVGNEGVAYAAVVPAEVEVILYQSLSLVNQPRSESARWARSWPASGLAGGGVGVAGWKYFGPADGDGRRGLDRGARLPGRRAARAGLRAGQRVRAVRAARRRPAAGQRRRPDRLLRVRRHPRVGVRCAGCWPACGPA